MYIFWQAGNILVDSNGAIKLGDFGVSACMFDTGDRQRSRKTFTGTPCWCDFFVFSRSWSVCKGFLCVHVVKDLSLLPTASILYFKSGKLFDFLSTYYLRLSSSGLLTCEEVGLSLISSFKFGCTSVQDGTRGNGGTSWLRFQVSNSLLVGLW
jgi:serine/threonine protein kinase